MLVTYICPYALIIHRIVYLSSLARLVSSRRVWKSEYQVHQSEGFPSASKSLELVV